MKTFDRPTPALSDVQTALEAGVAGYNVASWNSLAASAGTPPEVIEVLNRAAREALGSPAVRERLGTLALRVQASTPGDLQALLVSEIKRWGDVIRAAKTDAE